MTEIGGTISSSDKPPQELRSKLLKYTEKYEVVGGVVGVGGGAEGEEEVLEAEVALVVFGGGWVCSIRVVVRDLVLRLDECREDSDLLAEGGWRVSMWAESWEICLGGDTRGKARLGPKDIRIGAVWVSREG